MIASAIEELLAAIGGFRFRIIDSFIYLLISNSFGSLSPEQREQKE
ncbi:MAG: hypothetical protein ACJA2Q_002519 [Pseudohongiellaceae bacterium]|jgi:hypothetical protein